jgi:hypothetical protein
VAGFYSAVDKQLFPTRATKVSKVSKAGRAPANSSPQPTARPAVFEHGCPECGSLGKRHKKACSRSTANKEGERYPSGGRKPVKRQPCDECGSKGVRHKKYCSKAGRPRALTGNDEWARLEEAAGAAPRPSKMSRMTFGRVKISQSHDIPADAIARNLDVAIDEIEKGFDTQTYDEYLKL